MLQPHNPRPMLPPVALSVSPQGPIIQISAAVGSHIWKPLVWLFSCAGSKGQFQSHSMQYEFITAGVWHPR